MKRELRTLSTITELGMLFYWLFAAALALNIVHIDPSHMYSDYQEPLIVAWNWSFFPIDVVFALLGLLAKFAGFSPSVSQKLQLIASTLMICAGLMALSFWIIVKDFDPVWWSMNFWLIILCLGMIVAIFRKS